jgi:hypothetical protein
MDVRMILLCSEPLVTDMHSLEYPWMADVHLVQRLTRSEWRPNLLVLSHDVDQEAVARSLQAFCRPPFHICRPPAALPLPQDRRGTLFILNAGAMPLSQQMALYDWLDGGTPQVQVVSITRTSLYPLVEQGEFMEALFYRLNVVCVDASEPL